jgi:hypothetical protein
MGLQALMHKRRVLRLMAQRAALIHHNNRSRARRMP